MRRRGGSLLVLALLAAACTSGGDDPTADDTAAPTVAATHDTAAPTVAATDNADDGPAPTTTETAPDTPVADTGTELQRPDGPELPGLLDTSDEPILNDEAVRTGVLDNGLTYYVRSNDNPGSKVTLRLAIKAGSVDELGDATGLAHFAEHMLFNGTAAFPENRLIEVLRGFGADFGPDINAYTSFDETVYKLVVPNDADSVALGISVLEEWLSNATIDSAEVVKERGVVLDEWRVRTQTTQGRLFDVAQEIFLDGSAYDGRTPIGTAESIESMSAADLREFYDAWYRPDNAAIIVVGDIDPDAVVADVEAVFGAVTPRSDSLPDRSDLTFDVESEPDFGLHVDPDQQTVDVEVSLPIPGEPGSGTLDARTSFVDSMIYDALVRRLDQDRAAGVAPFDEITRGGNSFVSTLDAPALYASTDPDRVTETLVALLDEYARAFEFGFTVEETDLARRSLQSMLDTRYDGRDSRQDTDIADALVETFLTDAPYPTIIEQYRVLTDELAGITPEALDLRFRARWANTAPHVIISTPESDAARIPSRNEVLSLVTSTYGRPFDSREDLRELPDMLMERPDPIARTSSEPLLDTGVPIFDPTVLTFPNGVTVIYAPNTIVEGQVYLTAVSPGGSSQVADDDVVDALYASRIVTGGGIADFNAAELAKINADADVSVTASLTPYQDQFSGSAAASDLETLFQMLHLYFTQPRFDPVAIDRVRAQEQPLVDDPSTDPQAASSDALQDARYRDALRHTVIPSPDQFATLDLDGVERVWTERHADAGDWTFVFAGDLEPNEITQLSASYLATLPATGADEGFVDLGIATPAEPTIVSIEAGTGDTASVTMVFTTPVAGSLPEQRVEADIASQVLSARLTDVVREELGDSYSPFVVSYLRPDPAPTIETYVRISGSPDRIGAIAEVAFGEFADLAGGGMTQDEFDQAFALIEERYNFVNNNFFLDGIAGAQVFPELGIDSFLDRFDELGDVSRSDITDFIVEHVPLDRYVQVTAVPR